MLARKKKLLIIEDDPGLQSQLRWAFDGYKVLLAADRESALDQVQRHEPAVVTLDLGLPPDPANATEGLQVLEQILELAPHTKIIVVTGNDDRANAIRAIGLGAYDFYQKPVDPEVLGLIVERAYQLYDLEQEHQRLSSQREASPLEGIIAASPEMLKVCRMVERVASADATVLILGESGTGKELLAHAIHGLSPRKKKPFVAISCAAIPETLLESELFGYEKGAYTGADKQTPGKLQRADGGTLFLDEIGDLPQSLQAKLLRFLQERVIERLGGREEIHIDTRVVCATHQDLQEFIRDGKFREDLYYRINEVPLQVPPLRERKGDAVLLAQAFLRRFAQGRSPAVHRFSSEAIAAIEAHPWPGNVRELEHRVKRAVIMAEGSRIETQDLEFASGSPQETPILSLRQRREISDRESVEQALSRTQGNLTKAAQSLGISRPSLYSLMKKFEITIENQA
ncbi:PEP-CTERM-box response regulator transcription factor [Gammaproteobacteria bacterium]|nr:PEP-CTERM-box response regulator transcription factor [Gammaproteobacteria bacterium]